jgi:hypothetical protein
MNLAQTPSIMNAMYGKWHKMMIRTIQAMLDYQPIQAFQA